MFKLLHRVRQRPEKERYRLALTLAASITVVIFILWAVSFFSNLNAIRATADSSSIEEVKEPFEALLENFSHFRNKSSIQD